MVKKLDEIKIYEIAESGNTGCRSARLSSNDAFFSVATIYF